jgi:hypothetical protein
LDEAIPSIRRRLAEVKNVILESNSVLGFLRPDVYLSVLDPSTADFKVSAQKYLDQADAVILHGSSKKAAWNGVSLESVTGKSTFTIQPPNYLTPEIVEFLRGKLGTEN